MKNFFTPPSLYFTAKFGFSFYPLNLFCKGLFFQYNHVLTLQLYFFFLFACISVDLFFRCFLSLYSFLFFIFLQCFRFILLMNSFALSCNFLFRVPPLPSYFFFLYLFLPVFILSPPPPSSLHHLHLTSAFLCVFFTFPFSSILLLFYSSPPFTPLPSWSSPFSSYSSSSTVHSMRGAAPSN